MPKDVKTNVIVSVETKGLQEASQQAAKFNKGQAESAKEQSKYWVEASKHLDEVTKKTERARQAAEKHYQTTKNARRKQTEEEKAAQRAARRAESEEYQKGKRSRKREENEAYQAQRAAKRQQAADDRQRKQAFTQGLLQGGLPFPAPFLQRGPGMGRQVAGMMVGAGAKRGLGFMRGLGASGLSGISGIQQAVTNIPGVGQAAAGQIGIAAQMTQQFLQHQQTRLQAAPYIMDHQRIMQNRKLNIVQRRAEKAYEKALTKSARAAEDVRGQEAVQAGFDYDSKMMKEIIRRNPSMKKQLDPKRYERLKKRAAKLDAETADKKAAMEKLGVKSVTPGTQDIGALGLSLLGVNKSEALQAAMGIVQAGGGRIGEARDNQAIRLGFAAQTAYGVQGQTAGAFLRGGRRGGLVDARGRGGEAMVGAIQDALRMGLEGSEINSYLQMIAQGIQQFEQTGIPVADKSITGMSNAFAGGGVIGGDRAMRMGAGLTQYAQTIGTRGIKGGMDLMMLQMLGGYQGGGAQDLQQAFINMEQMRGTLKGRTGATINTEDATADMLRRIIELGGGGSGGEMMMRSMLARMGVQMGHAEAKLLGARLTGGTLTDEEEAAAQAEMARKAGLTAEAADIGRTDKEGRNVGLTGKARGTVSRLASRVRAQKSIENRQIAVGRQMAGSVQALQRAATNTNEAFTNLVEGPLKKFAGWMEYLTGQVKELSTVVGDNDVG